MEPTRFATWDDDKSPATQPTDEIARLEQRRRETVAALSAPAEYERVQREKLAQVDQEIAQAKAQRAANALQAARGQLHQDYQANQTAINDVTSALGGLVDKLKNGGEIPPLLNAVPNSIDPTFERCLRTASSALGSQDAYLSQTTLGATGDSPQVRSDFLQGMMDASGQVLNGPIAYPATLALQRWIASAPAGGPDRTLRAALCFILTGDPGMIQANERANWDLIARDHFKACLQAGRVLPLTQILFR